ncbi:MAG: 50S ribosomal protein L22 [Desulfobacterales bacterium]|nr:50S ribosomal protein L22 [Desulfobacterales bacterium]
MEAKAVLKYVRISPLKVRRLTGSVKGKSAEAGIEILKFMPQKAAGIVEKVVRSAVANAGQNSNIDVDSLIIRNILVDQGPVLKRFSARARGRGTRILKRTSHITVILSEGSA